MILSWDIYEIESSDAMLHGVKLRGRIRKFAIEQGMNCLVENATDKENGVRFALESDSDITLISDFVKILLPEAEITKVMDAVQNPVLSKLKVNDVSRY